MKPNKNDKPDKGLNQSLPMVNAEKNCTDFNSLLNYLKNHQHELKSNLKNHGAVVIRGYEVKTPEQFQQVGLSIFPNLQNQYPGGAPRHKVAEYVWTAREI